MKIGLTYNLRSDYELDPDAPPDRYGEFDSEETVANLAQVIESLGHEVRRIGGIEKLVTFLAAGETVDLVFNIAEGLWSRSREAQVPALLDAFRIPYTGSDPVTLALCLDKALTKRLWQREGLATLDCWVVSSEAQLDPVAASLPDFPLFAKPLYEGSSKGIGPESILQSRQQLVERTAWLLATYQQPVLIEEYLPGREFTVGMLGNDDEAWTLGALEVSSTSPGGVSGFYDKEEWEIRAPNYYTHVEPSPLRDEIYELALRAYLAVGSQDFGRVDIRLDKGGKPQLLEINPLPAVHPTHSALTTIAKNAGLSHRELIAAILQNASKRAFSESPVKQEDAK